MLTRKVVAGMIVVALAGCAKATIVNSNSIVEDNIEYYIQTDKAIYDLGDNVEMLFRVTNLADTDVVLGEVIADPLAYYDFRIMQDGSQIWEYPYMSVVLAFGPFDLGSYESKEFQTVWNMMNDNGTPWLPDDDFPVSAGIYEVVGELDLISGERVPVSVSIEIIPEPSCGDANHPYPVGDLNYDCRVDFYDFLIFAAHWLECTAPECETIVEVSVTTDESTYLLGEEVTVFVTAYNPNPQAVTLYFGTTLEASYLMDGVFDWTEDKYFAQVIGQFTIEPYDSYTWNLCHGPDEMAIYPLDVGTHTVVGEVVGYGQSAPVEFEVVP